ncbi:MAG: riboflavin synthase [Actinomycetota bacterium]
MFTGIIAELGQVAATEPVNGGVQLLISADRTLEGLQIGDSVAVNGVCLTVVSQATEGFVVQVVDESLARSALGSLGEASPVNLERPLAADGRFDGHIVQGHVDGVGIVTSVVDEGDASRMRISMPRDLERYVVEKGSITVDGTSLTVTAVNDRDSDTAWFEIVLIPHTLAVTVFGTTTVGSQVNLEVDVIAKYVERMLGAHR